MYSTSKEIAEIWNISDRRVRILCQQGRIPSVVKVGRQWNIPKGSVKPVDRRESIDMFNNIKYSVDNSLEEIDKKKKILDSKRPFPQNTINSLRENLILNWTYNSNSIEGNTLTLSETKVVLEGITVGGKTMIEHLEAINHKDAILYVEDLVKNKTNLIEVDIRNIHKIVLTQIDNKNSGKYRTENVIISGAKHIPPEHFDVKIQIEKLVETYNNDWNNVHPIIRSALLHGEFVKIHPFIDR